jgi:hypothetical protein
LTGNNAFRNRNCSVSKFDNNRANMQVRYDSREYICIYLYINHNTRKVYLPEIMSGSRAASLGTAWSAVPPVLIRIRLPLRVGQSTEWERLNSMAACDCGTLEYWTSAGAYLLDALSQHQNKSIVSILIFFFQGEQGNFNTTFFQLLCCERRWEKWQIKVNSTRQQAGSQRCDLKRFWALSPALAVADIVAPQCHVIPQVTCATLARSERRCVEPKNRILVTFYHVKVIWNFGTMWRKH